MKRLIILFNLLLACVLMNAQNSVWWEKGENILLVGEIKDAHENHFNYLYVESEWSRDKTMSTYVLASRDQKWWDKNIWIHAEFRTFVGESILTDNIYLIGPMFELAAGKYGFLNLQTLYRYENGNGVQLTLLGDVEYKRLYYSMFMDNYTNDEFRIHSENRIFFKIINPVSIGANFIVTYNEVNSGFHCKPMAVIRLDI